MAEKVFKVNEPIEIVYQAPNAESGLDSIRADIYDESKALKEVDQPLTEVGNSGTYRRSFTPDAQGEWEVVIYKFVDSDTRDGQVVKRYSVGAHNVHSVGEGVGGVATAVADVDADVVVVGGLVGTVDGKVDGVDSKATDIKAKTDALPSDPASEANVDAAETVIRSDIANLDTKVSSLDTPPMVS